VDALLRDAAEEQVRDAAPAMRAMTTRTASTASIVATICSRGRSGSRDGVRGREPSADALERLLELAPGGLFERRPQIPAAHRHARIPVDGELAGVHERERRRVGKGQVHRDVGGAPRCIAKVGRYQDVLELRQRIRASGVPKYCFT
jgi:hypothetical protein